MDDLQGKVALVTGGGSGINLAFVRLLHAAGCRILIADLVLHSSASAWLSSLPATQVDNVIFHRTDVTSWPDLASAFAACVIHFDDVPDIVVPGAGVFEPSHNSFWADVDKDSHYAILDINLVHPIKATRIAVRQMVERKKGGVIVHVSSIAGQRSSLVTPLYTASKHGINSFVRGMAPLQDLCGIRVVGVAPGTIGSPLYTEHPEAHKFLDLEKDFLLPPEEVAKAMMALVKNAKYPPGTVLEVCDIDNWREVSLLNDSGPCGPASTTSRKAEAIEEVKKFLRVDN